MTTWLRRFSPLLVRSSRSWTCPYRYESPTFERSGRRVLMLLRIGSNVMDTFWLSCVLGVALTLILSNSNWYESWGWPCNVHLRIEITISSWITGEKEVLFWADVSLSQWFFFKVYFADIPKFGFVYYLYLYSFGWSFEIEYV